MKNLAFIAIALVFGAFAGAAFERLASPLPAMAQTATPSASPMTPMQGMPMEGMMANCPAMQSMMQKAQSPADRALMQSMMSMHQSMQSMQLTGDADHDFLVMMVPHHQVAIAMSNAEIQNGKDQKVIALAKSIIAAQQQEINQMQGWLH